MSINKLVKSIKDNKSEVEKLISEKQDWNLAQKRFDSLFNAMANPSDNVWSDATIKKLTECTPLKKKKIRA